MARRRSTGEYILSFLAGAIPSYAQGSQMSQAMNSKAALEERKRKEKLQDDFLKRQQGLEDKELDHQYRMAEKDQPGLGEGPRREITKGEYFSGAMDDVLIDRKKKFFDAELAQRKAEDPNMGKAPLVKIGVDTFERARQGALGTAAGKAETTINSVNAIVGDVGDMFGMFDSIPDAMKGNVIAGGTLGQAGKLTQADTKAYYDTRQLTLANIAKKLGGEVGVLTDKDISRIERALPDVIDTPEAVEMKKKFIYNYMDRRVKAYQKTARLEEKGIGLLKGFQDTDVDVEQPQPWETEEEVQGAAQPDTGDFDVEAHLERLGL